MTLIVVLDTGPLGLITNPRPNPERVAAAGWSRRLEAAGHRLVVPAIADYEVRRELLRAGKRRSIAELDRFNALRPDRYLRLTDRALKLAADLWAQARRIGSPTADPKELDADVLIAAQALDLGVGRGSIVVATTNPGHLSRFVPSELWQAIQP